MAAQKDKTKEELLEEIVHLQERIAKLEAAGPGDKKGTEEKLLLLKILDESQDFIGVADLQGNLQYHNSAARRMVGLPEDADLSRMKIRDMHPDWGAKLVQEEGIPTVLSQGFWKSENALLHRNGTEIPVSQVLVVHRNSSGEPECISTSMRDITEQKKAEKELARFKILFDLSQDAIMTLEPPNWGFTSGNLATVKLFGAGDEVAFISKKPWELSPEFQPDGTASSEKAPKMIQKAMEEGKNFFEWTHKRINGEEFFATVLLTRIEIEKGKFFLQATVRDITEHKKIETMLRASESKYKLLVENIPEKIFLKDRNSVYIFCNKNYATDLKIEPEEIVGKTDFEFYPNEAAKKYVADDKRIMESGKATALEEKYIQDGHEQFVSTIKTPIWDAQGHITGILGIFHDITQRKQTEEDLKRISQQNELILNSAAEGILGLDLQGKHTFINTAAAKMLGYEAGELLDRPSHITWHHTRSDGSPYPKAECRIYAAYKDGAVHRVSTEVFWRKDGTCFPVEYTSTPIYEQGRLTGAVVVFSDITERKKTEETLKQSEAMFKSVVTTVPIGLGIASSRKIEWMNDYLLELIGRREEEVVGKDARMLYADEEAYLDVANRLYEVLKTTSTAEIETFWKHKDGRILNIDLKGTFLEQRGESRKIFFCVMDITERKRIEEKERQQLRELEVFYKASIGREERVLELKKEVASLKKELGK